MTAARSFVAALLLCSAAFLGAVEGCGFQYPAVVGRVPANDAEVPDGAYTNEEVLAHFSNQGLLRGADALKTTFSCVDARGNDALLGTPGGTFSEFAMGLMVYEQLRDETLEYADVNKLFLAFMSSRYISPSNRFYFHNADLALDNLFSYLKEEKDIDASILPDMEPKENADDWYDALVQPASNGCGHVRLQLEGNAAYGERAQAISTMLIKVFYKYWWPTPLNSKERKRIINEILPGALGGQSVTIIDATSAADLKGRRLLLNATADIAATTQLSTPIPAGSTAAAAMSAYSAAARRRPVDRSNKCSTIWPLVAGTRGGSSVFAYHQGAVAQYRDRIITVWFDQQDNARGYRFSRSDFAEALAALAQQQLEATLTNLEPANAVGITIATYQRTK